MIPPRDDYGDEDTDPGHMTIIGPLLTPRPPAKTGIVLSYVDRYPPKIDDPLSLTIRIGAIADPVDSFDRSDDDAEIFDPDPPESFALGSQRDKDKL